MPIIGRAPLAPTVPGAQKLRSEAHLRVCRNDEVAAQRRRWTFYETIKNYRFQDEGRQEKNFTRADRRREIAGGPQ